MTTTIGVDIGGTTTEVVRLDRAGVVEQRIVQPTRIGSHLVDGTLAAIRAVAREQAVEVIGVGVPGQVDAASGHVRHAVNLDVGGRGVPLGPALAEALATPVLIENDVRAAALGAHRHLPGAAVDTLVLLGIGTGVAAGVVLNGRIHRGRDGLAGEIGHVVLDPDGPRCACGLTGCLEALVAGPAIAARWSHGAGAPAADLFASAAAGDEAAIALAGTVARHLGRAVHWLTMTYGADLVVLGGGVGGVGASLRTAVHEALEDLVSRSELAAGVLSPERVVSAPADLPLGALGAAELARDHLGGRVGLGAPGNRKEAVTPDLAATATIESVFGTGTAGADVPGPEPTGS